MSLIYAIKLTISVSLILICEYEEVIYSGRVFLIRIKACDNLSFFLLLKSFKRVKLLRRLFGLPILMSLSGPFNLAPGGLSLLLP